MSPGTNPSLVRLDWKAYWESFQSAHGGNPIPWRKRLLFADGWSYARKDHAGPEWPPPADPEELRQVQTFYWRARLAIVTRERDGLRNTLEQLKALQSARSVPLQQVLQHWDAEGKGVLERIPVNLGALAERLGWLEGDVQYCEGQLEGLGVSSVNKEQP